MLDSEEAKQERIDSQGPDGKTSLTGIDGFRNEEVSDKADGVKKRHEEDQVCDDPIEECCEPAHGVCLLSQSLVCPEDAFTKAWPWTPSLQWELHECYRRIISLSR
jgi:hypothetical protein